MTKYISDEEHYNEVLSRVSSVKTSLWIGTADIKDLYVKTGAAQTPFLGVIAKLIERGVDVRLIHAKEPGPIFREEFDRYPVLATRLERALCPRVHFKILVFDGAVAYIGSANLTGAGILSYSPSHEQDSNFLIRHLCYIPVLLSLLFRFQDSDNVINLFPSGISALNPGNLASALQKHISASDEAFRSRNVDNREGLLPCGGSERQSGWKIGFDGSGDNRRGRPLRRDDEMYSRCTSFLGQIDNMAQNVAADFP